MHRRLGRKNVVIKRAVGQQLGFQFVSDTRGLGARVTHVTPGGLASSKIDAGDRIIEIDGFGGGGHAPCD